MGLIYNSSDNTLVSGRTVGSSECLAYRKVISCSEECRSLWKDGQLLVEGKDYELKKVDTSIHPSFDNIVSIAYPIKQDKISSSVEAEEYANGMMGVPSLTKLEHFADKQLHSIIVRSYNAGSNRTKTDIVSIINRYEAGMAEYYMQHNYREQYSLWEQFTRQVKGEPIKQDNTNEDDLWGLIFELVDCSSKPPKENYEAYKQRRHKLIQRMKLSYTITKRKP